ncbi:MAG: Gfo/Idh/MocA family oxidoreductase [Pseudomonadota bacterium]
MIRIGLLGASRIARGAIIEPASATAEIEVAAVAGRSPQTARDYAAEHGIDRVAPDYESLIAADDIDLVYNALPPSEHKGWTIAALAAQKHVLCEKPFALNAEEAVAMVDAAGDSGCVLIEAFHYRFHPAFGRVLEILRSNVIGSIREVRCHFDIAVPCVPGEFRYDKRLGGGALMDLGCYPVHWARTVVGEEPEVVSATGRWHESGVDVAMEAALEFPGGVTARISSSMSEDLPDRLDAELCIAGEEGELTLINPLAPHLGHELRVRARNEERTETADGESTYHHQLRHVVDVLNGATGQVTGGADAVANMRVLDAIYRLAGE